MPVKFFRKVTYSPKYHRKTTGEHRKRQGNFMSTMSLRNQYLNVKTKNPCHTISGQIEMHPKHITDTKMKECTVYRRLNEKGFCVILEITIPLIFFLQRKAVKVDSLTTLVERGWLNENFIHRFFTPRLKRLILS